MSVARLTSSLKSAVCRMTDCRVSLVTLGIAAAAVLFALLPSVPVVFGQTTTTTTAAAAASNNGLGLVAAAAAIVGSCAAAAYAVAKAASSAAAAIVERPGAFGPMLILAGLGEGIAIYGLLVAFQILSKIP